MAGPTAAMSVTLPSDSWALPIRCSMGIGGRRGKGKGSHIGRQGLSIPTAGPEAMMLHPDATSPPEWLVRTLVNTPRQASSHKPEAPQVLRAGGRGTGACVCSEQRSGRPDSLCSPAFTCTRPAWQSSAPSGFQVRSSGSVDGCRKALSQNSRPEGKGSPGI